MKNNQELKSCPLMAREIIFRGKRIDNGQWVEGSLLYDPDLEQYQICGFNYLCSENGLERDDFCYIVTLETVGQYTGLKDKKGKKIFEGDIVKAKENRTNDIATISFENGGFIIHPHSGKILERTLWEYWYNDWDLEVIGNIHDNPELLEVE